jgi:hypothetical protein
MARYDIKVLSPIELPFSQTPIVASGTTASIKAGEPTKAGSAGAVAIMVDADGTSSQRFTGIAKSDSSETASAAGNVQVWLPLPGMIYAAKAKSFAAADTQAEIDALYYKRVIFDLTSGAWTIDTAAADNTANAVVIVGGEFQTGTVYFAYSYGSTIFE